MMSSMTGTTAAMQLPRSILGLKTHGLPAMPGVAAAGAASRARNASLWGGRVAAAGGGMPAGRAGTMVEARVWEKTGRVGGSAACRVAASGREGGGGQEESERGREGEGSGGEGRDTGGGVPWWQEAVRGATGAAVAAGIAILLGSEAANAADVLKTCTCLLQECRPQLVRCLGDVKCAANIACLQSCNGRPDETECQIACGDLFENEVVDAFNACAITEKNCVPQKPNEDLYPVPPTSAVVSSFEVSSMEGPWYITSGLNKTFDTFDCQLHFFKVTGPASFEAQLTWRINTPDGGFFTRSALQEFVQDPELPALLLNHDNEFLHYQDDWYILSSNITGGPDDYFFVYYRGSNDAWDGYGGAVVYSRSKTLPPAIIPELEAAARRVNLNFADFTTTDNTCGPELPLFARLEKKVEEVEGKFAAEVERLEQKVILAGRDEVKLFGSLGKGFEEVRKDQQQFLKGLKVEDRKILEQMKSMEMGDAEDLEDLFSNPIPLRKLRNID